MTSVLASDACDAMPAMRRPCRRAHFARTTCTGQTVRYYAQSSWSLLVAIGAKDQAATLLCDHPFESTIELVVEYQGHSHINPARILEIASVGIA